MRDYFSYYGAEPPEQTPERRRAFVKAQLERLVVLDKPAEQYGPPRPIQLDFPDDFVKLDTGYFISKSLAKWMSAGDDPVARDD